MGTIKEQVTDLLSLPKEVILNLPQVTLTGRQEISIENYKGIIEFTDTLIRINTRCGILLITGRNLRLKHINIEYIIVIGDIGKLKYLR